MYRFVKSDIKALDGLNKGFLRKVEKRMYQTTVKGNIANKICSVLYYNKENGNWKEEMMQTLNGNLMAGNLLIATVENGTITACDKKFLPLQLCRTANVESWLADRAIDRHRPNSRLLKKILRLRTAEDMEVALEVNGATLTDNYWFCPLGSDKTYDDVKFLYNYFDTVALAGDPDGFSQKPSKTPELTNIGSYEKCWKVVDGKWWLYKAGSDAEYFSELFICRLGIKMNFDTARYEMDQGYIKTADFTEGRVNFETMSGITGDDDDYELCFNALLKISQDIAKQYLKLIWIDTLCYNMDRHTKNFGILRSRQTGEILSLAPNYDNNIALISRGYVKDVSRQKDGIIRFFNDFVSENETVAAEYRKMLENGEIPLLCETDIAEVLCEITADFTKISEDSKDYLNAFILNGQKIMCEIIEENS